MVVLSGGPLGGAEVDGEAWDLGTEREIDGLIYRRDEAVLAVYCGIA